MVGVPRIILGFKVSSSSGRICRAMRAFSRVNEGLMLLMWWVYFPRCVIISM